MTYEPKDMEAMKTKSLELLTKLQKNGVGYLNFNDKCNCYNITARFLQDVYQQGYDDAILMSKL